MDLPKHDIPVELVGGPMCGLVLWFPFEGDEMCVHDPWGRHASFSMVVYPWRAWFDGDRLTLDLPDGEIRYERDPDHDMLWRFVPPCTL